MSTDFEKLVELTNKVIESERRRDAVNKELTALMDSSTDGYWDWHVPSNTEFMSPRFWEILGEDHLTKTNSPDEWIKMVHPDDLEPLMKKLQDHFSSMGTTPFISEVRYIKSNGDLVWILCKGRVVEWGGDGQPIRMVGTHSDITSLKGGSL